jgi:predicted RNA binding protein YcfA (HicA-like mRNA interferase family)
MPKLLRDVSHDRVVRFLLKRGWSRIDGARHTLLVRGQDEVTVPRHTSIKTGTLAQILKAAGVTPEEWHEL